MKYAFMSFSCPELGIDELISVARSYGYDGIELRIESGHRHGAELGAGAAERGAIRRKAEEGGIALCCLATSRRFANPETAAQEIDLTLRCIDLAADIGSPRLRVFGGAIPEGVERETAIKLLADSLRSTADHAKARGVTVCLETHDHWCEPHHVAEVMKRANHPAVAVNWDIMHPARQGFTMDEAFDALRPWIRHVHFHDGLTIEGKLKLAPVGQGEIDLRRAVELLLADSYDGFLSGEWINWEPYETHLPRELAAMKQYERVRG